jgi:hypothetical protein
MCVDVWWCMDERRGGAKSGFVFDDIPFKADYGVIIKM